MFIFFKLHELEGMSEDRRQAMVDQIRLRCWGHSRYIAAKMIVFVLIASSCGGSIALPENDARPLIAVALIIATIVMALFINEWMVIDLFRRELRRHIGGMCEHCGYDLKGTVEANQEVCPECGKAFDLLESKRVLKWIDRRP